MRWQIARGLAMLVLMPLALVNCTRPKSFLNHGLPLQETLRINLGTEPPSLDWSKSSDNISNIILSNIMEGLTQVDTSGEQYQVKPALATAWSSDQKLKKWTFQLRPDVYWTDGKLLTAQHFVDSWERVLNPNSGSPYSYYLFPIKNSRAYSEGRIKDFSQVGVAAPRKDTLVVELTDPISFFPYLPSHHALFPIRNDVIKASGDGWTEPDSIQTLGVYRLKFWDHNRRIILERNSRYYGPKARTKNILAYMINEPATALSLFESGGLDLLLDLPSQQVLSWRKSKAYHWKEAFILQYLGFNTKAPPFDKVEVRKAIAQAIDRSQVIRVLGGAAQPLSAWVPAGVIGHNPAIGLPFDVAQAKKFLRSAGYADPKKFPRAIYALSMSEDHLRVGENIQSQLRQNLGIAVTLRVEEWKVYLSTLRFNTPPIFRMGWQADYPDPHNFLNLMTSTSENNFTRWKNRQFDRFIDLGLSEGQPAQRQAIYERAQKILVEEEVPVVPLYLGGLKVLVSSRTRNFNLNALGRYLFGEVELE